MGSETTSATAGEQWAADVRQCLDDLDGGVARRLQALVAACPRTDPDAVFPTLRDALAALGATHAADPVYAASHAATHTFLHRAAPYAARACADLVRVLTDAANGLLNAGANATGDDRIIRRTNFPRLIRLGVMCGPSEGQLAGLLDGLPAHHPAHDCDPVMLPEGAAVVLGNPDRQYVTLGRVRELTAVCRTYVVEQERERLRLEEVERQRREALERSTTEARLRALETSAAAR